MFHSLFFFFFSFLGWGETVHLVRLPLTGLLYQPRMIDDDECGAVCGMIIGKGNRSTRRKPVPVPLCPPQIPHDLTWAGTRATAVWKRRLTDWAMARPHFIVTQRYPIWINSGARICDSVTQISMVCFRSFNIITEQYGTIICRHRNERIEHFTSHNS
jgi:hypothetical protein